MRLLAVQQCKIHLVGIKPVGGVRQKVQKNINVDLLINSFVFRIQDVTNNRYESLGNGNMNAIK